MVNEELQTNNQRLEEANCTIKERQEKLLEKDRLKVHLVTKVLAEILVDRGQGG